MEQEKQRITMVGRDQILQHSKSVRSCFGLESIMLPCIALLFTFQCCKPSSTIQPFPDPFADSFRHKNIKWLIGYDPGDSSILDTTFFDKGGNIVRKVGMMSDIRMQFDGKGFVVRQMQSGENSSNFLIEYSIDSERVMKQEWWQLEGTTWDYVDKDRKSLFRQVNFEFDKTGRLVQEFDLKENERIAYRYEEDRLVAKEKFDIKSGVLVQFWSFLYDDGGGIKEINFSNPEFRIKTYYYSNARLDSTVDDIGTIKYRYFYY